MAKNKKYVNGFSNQIFAIRREVGTSEEYLETSESLDTLAPSTSERPVKIALYKLVELAEVSSTIHIVKKTIEGVT